MKKQIKIDVEGFGKFSLCDAFDVVKVLRSLREYDKARKVQDEILKVINVSKIRDWFEKQICSTFPKFDPRCFVFCCSPSKKCNLRNYALMKVGMNIDDYILIKRKSSGYFEGVLANHLKGGA